MEARHIKPALAALLALGLLGLLGTADASSIYRWTAPDGTVSYGSSPPPDADAERVRGAPGPATSGRDGDRARQETPSSETRDATDEADSAEQLTERERQCAKAEENMEILRNPATQLTTTQEGGEPEPMTEEMREQLLQETREFYDEWCR